MGRLRAGAEAQAGVGFDPGEAQAAGRQVPRLGGDGRTQRQRAGQAAVAGLGRVAQDRQRQRG
eukprot:5661923-Pyramimonas_sp.AAC.1